MFHCACNYLPDIVNYFNMNDLLAMSYSKVYIQISGIKDLIFPINGAEEMFLKRRKVYEEYGLGEKSVMLKCNGGDRFLLMMLG